MCALKAAVFFLLLAPLLGSGCATLQPSVLGRSVTVQTIDGGRQTTGELLGVEDGQLIVRGRATVEKLPLVTVRDVQVERHAFGYKKGLLWSAIGGLATGAALYASCRSVSTGCQAVGLGAFGFWMSIGTVASLSMESTTHFHLRRPKDEELRNYSRFPQGVPPGLDLESLLPPGPPRPRAAASGSGPETAFHGMISREE